VRSAARLIAILGLLLAGAGCTGGTFVDLPFFPDNSCRTCGTPSLFERTYR
jgi:hypothetical protein